MQSGQTIHIKGTPVTMIGPVQLNERGSQREYVVVEIPGGVYIKNGLHVSKFLIPVAMVDEHPKQFVEVVDE